MSRLSIAQAIQAIGRPVFTTREIAALRGGSVSATSQGLRRMESKGLLRGVSRGVWCAPADPKFAPLSLVPYLAGGHQAYVSFLSALHLHGLLEQIPQTVYAATTGPTRLKQTPFGAFSFHRIDPNFFKGYDWHGAGRDVLIASPEKAVVDCFYVSSRRGKRFTFLPEIDLGNGFDLDRAVDWIEQIRDPMIRSYSRERVAKLIQRNT